MSVGVMKDYNLKQRNLRASHTKTQESTRLSDTKTEESTRLGSCLL